MDSYWFSAIADWLVNLSVGWFAAGILFLFINKPRNLSKKRNHWQLTANFLLSMLSLTLAAQIKRSLGVL